MKPRGRQVIARINPSELMRFFSVKNGVWQVRCKGLPEDCRVISVSWDNHRDLLEFVLETNDERAFYELGDTQEPPERDLYTSILFVEQRT